MKTASKTKVTKEISAELKMPEHLAIIMDGNRRWATRNKLKYFFGHRKGTDVFEDTLRYLNENKVKAFTVYAFSTENWKRDEKQVKDLLKVMAEAIVRKGDEMVRENIVFRVIGRLEDFPLKLRNSLIDLIEKTKQNTGIILNVALSYGGRDEIIRAVNKLIDSGVKKATEADFCKFLDTSCIKDPELIIRTGGDKRLSNFLLWQSSYSELFFTNTLWPDFSITELNSIIKEYNIRKKNFGK